MWRTTAFMALVHMAVRGESPIAIQWRGGHTDFKTTQGYLDRGRVEARRIGEPLPPLPEGIVHESSRTIPDPPNAATSLGSAATPTGIEFGLRPSRKLSADAVLGAKSRELLEEPVAVGFRWGPSHSVGWSGVTAT